MRLFVECKNGYEVDSKHYAIELDLAGTSGEAEFVCRGTVLDAYNVVTDFGEHYRLSKMEDTTRLKSMWFKSGDRIKKQVFKVAVSMPN